MAHGTKHTEEEIEDMAERFGRGDDGVAPDDEGELVASDDSKGSMTFTIRLPKSTVAALKAAAEREDVGATVLARRWITERLQDDTVPDDAVVRLTDVIALARRVPGGMAEAVIASESRESVNR
jgi:hypothetical protein